MSKLSLCVALLCSITTVNAIELIADDRHVEVFSTDGNSESRPSFPFAAFTTNGQNTTVSNIAFGGSGSGSGYSDFDYFIRQSIFDVTFSANSVTTLDLDGTLSGNAGDFGLATVHARLFAGSEIDGQNEIYAETLSADSFDDVSINFSFTDTLAAGTYRLVLKTDITPGGFGTYGDFSFTASFESDSDNDGIPDANDNCINVANAGQIDANGDNFGNACDADLNDDCIVNAADLGLLRLAFFSTDPTADLNSDGVVNVADLGILRSQFFMPPGPSGLTENCIMRTNRPVRLAP